MATIFRPPLTTLKRKPPLRRPLDESVNLCLAAQTITPVVNLEHPAQKRSRKRVVEEASPNLSLLHAPPPEEPEPIFRAPIIQHRRPPPPRYSADTPINLPLLSVALTAYSLTADSGSVVVTGTAATLTYDAVEPITLRAPIITSRLTKKRQTQPLYANLSLLSSTPETIFRPTILEHIQPRRRRKSSASGLNLSQLLFPKILTADGTTYTIGGTDATLRRTYALSAASGTYTISGTTVAVRRSYVLAATSGAYVVTGSAANLISNPEGLIASSGTFTITGTDAAMRHAHRVSVDSGSFTVTGTAATLKLASLLAAESGAFVIAGTPAVLRRGFTLSANAGSYTITGFNTAGGHQWVLTSQAVGPGSGQFLVTGSEASLIASTINRVDDLADTSTRIQKLPYTTTPSTRQASFGSVTGTNTEPFTINHQVLMNGFLAFSVNNGASVEMSFDNGVYTAQQIADEINAEIPGIIATAVNGRVHLTTAAIGVKLELLAGDDYANDTLGLPVGEYPGFGNPLPYTTRRHIVEP